MLGFVMVGTNNLHNATTFYSELMSAMGAHLVNQNEKVVAWKLENATFCVTRPVDGEPATFGNGTMIAFNLPDFDAVDALYKKAMEMGAADEGEPGLRGDGAYYAAYLRDLDGNKINLHAFPD